MLNLPQHTEEQSTTTNHYLTPMSIVLRRETLLHGLTPLSLIILRKNFRGLRYLWLSRNYDSTKIISFLRKGSVWLCRFWQQFSPFQTVKTFWSNTLLKPSTETGFERSKVHFILNKISVKYQKLGRMFSKNWNASLAALNISKVTNNIWAQTW